MRLVEKFARHCGLADAEKNWLLEEVDEAARGGALPQLSPCGEDESPSQQELTAFDAVLRDLLADGSPTAGKQPEPGEKPSGTDGRSADATRPERAALRAKVARGCLRGFEQEGLFLADDTIVAAVGALHSIGAFEPDDVHHLATFLGQATGMRLSSVDGMTAAQGDGPPGLEHLASVCEELVLEKSLTTVHRVDLILAMLACGDLPQAARIEVLEALVAAEAVEADSALPRAVGLDILQRVLRGSNLYKPFLLEDSEEYLDARPVWLVTADDPQRCGLVDSLGELATQLTAENRDRARAEAVDVDEMLDWLDSDDGVDLLEDWAYQVAERLPEFMGLERSEPHAGPCGYHSSNWAIAPELAPLENQIQLSCEEREAPRRAADTLLVGLSQMLDELWHDGVEPGSFAASLAVGESSAEAVLLDTVDHVIDCSLPDSINRAFFSLGQLGELSDDDVERLREMALAARDSLQRGGEVTIPADLVELLAPFEPRTEARLNRVADEDLTFAACRLLVQNGAEAEEVARVAGSFWSEHSLERAGPDTEWVSRFVQRYANLFPHEVVASARGKAQAAPAKPLPASWIN